MTFLIYSWSSVAEKSLKSSMFSSMFYNNNKPSTSSRISRQWQNIMGIFEHFARTPSSEQSCFLFLDAFFSFLSIEKKVLSFFSCFMCSFFLFCFGSSPFSDAKKRETSKRSCCKSDDFPLWTFDVWASVERELGMTHVRVTSAFVFSFFVCFPHLLCGSVFAFAFFLFSSFAFKYISLLAFFRELATM